MMSIKHFIIGAAVLIALTLLQDRVFAKKEYKARLALLIPIVLLYAFLATFAYTKVYLKYSPSILNQFNISNNSPYVIIISNALLIIGYLMVKLISAGILKKLWSKRTLVNFTSSSVYSYEEIYDIWFLQYRWTNYRMLLRSIRWGVVFAAAIFLGVSDSIGENGSFYLTFPYIIVIAVNELYFFFNGETKEEFEHNIYGIDSDSRRAGQYFRIREILEKVLPEPLLP